MGVIEPDWDREVIGLHHFSFSETLMVADAKTGAG